MSECQTVIEELRCLADWEPPVRVWYSNAIGKDEITVIAKALLLIIENLSSNGVKE